MRNHTVVRVLLFLGVLLLAGETAHADLPSRAPGGNGGNGTFRVRPRRDLRFGTVIAGIPSSVSWTSATAGRWFIQGRAGAEVFLDFVNLPSSLQNGGNSMPISFATDDAVYALGPKNNNAVSFDPNAGTTVRLDSRTGHLTVWIGGTVNPPQSQQPGSYIADITLEVTYTGN